MPGKVNKPLAIAPSAKSVKNGVVKNMKPGLPSWAPLVIVAFTALLYAHTLQNNFTVLDDDAYILNNPFLKNFSLKGIVAILSSFYSGNYHPLTTLSWFIEYNLFEANPLPFHLVNVLLHLVNTWLVYKLAERLSGSNITAAVTSLLFAIHPMHVESVAWVSERKDVLYALFYLLTLLHYLRYMASGFRKKNYWFCLVLFIASLLSKSAAVTLPVLMLVVDYYKGRKVDARTLAEKIPFFLLSLLFGVLAILSQRAAGTLSISLLSYGIINGSVLFLSGIAFYIAWLIVPAKLAIMHCYPAVHNGMLPVIYYLSVPLLVCLAWLCFRRTAYRRELLFGVSFFLVTISVMLQIISAGLALTAERYSYIPSIGLFYIAGQCITYFSATRRRTITIALSAAVMAAFLFVTYNRIGVWKDDGLLFNDVIEKYPDVYYGYWLRGNMEKKLGDLQPALADYTECIKLNPQYYDAVFNRANTYDATGNLQEALADYNKAIELKPGYADAYNNRGWLLFRMGDTVNAMTNYNKAIATDPLMEQAYNNRGWAYQVAGNRKAAMDNYSKAIELNPSFILPYQNRANIKANSGDLSGAAADYSTIIKINPEDKFAYYYRGIIRYDLKDIHAACEDWKMAQQLGNNDAATMIGQYCH